MLKRVSPIQFDRNSESGRTRPAIITCETAAGDAIEVVAKFSKGCDEGVASLGREVIAACLAADLGLPIPEPFLVDVSPEWAAVVTDPAQRARIQASSPVAFGSKHLGNQYVAWSCGRRILDSMLPTATAIFVFDAIIQNVDRRADNPNCLVKGNEIRIIDHEMAFTHALVLGWRPPWTPGSLKDLEKPGLHIFRDQLRRRAIDLSAIRDAWSALSDAQIVAYGTSIPAEWAAADQAVRRALALIRDARDNIDGCLAEVERILR